jgi:NAD-dependent deacetylase
MLSQFKVWLSDETVRKAAWRSRVEKPLWDAKANDGHRVVNELVARGALEAVITQNIDRLHHDAGTPADKIIEIHGNVHESVCLSCGERHAIAIELERVRRGDHDPHCLELIDDQACHGILKSATISFGQSLIEHDLDRARAAAIACDVMLCVGSTLGVYPAAGLVPIAVNNGAYLIIVNGEPTGFDDLADALFHADITKTLLALLAA